MDGFALILIGGVGILVALSIAIAMWAQKKRTEAWQRAARELGVAFLNADNDVLGRCSGMKSFRKGRSRRFYNALQADAGDTRITVGDYRYTTGSGRNQTTHVQTRCLLERSGMQLPHCYLRPQSALLDKIGALFGGQDIDFAEDRPFSSAYVLQGDSEFAVRELFDPYVRAWFADRRGSRLHFEAWGDQLVFHSAKKQNPDEARQLMQDALEIVNLLRPVESVVS